MTPRALAPKQGRLPARALIHVPIVHSEADLGGLASSVRTATVRRLGRQAWRRNVEVVNRMWEEIRQKIEGLDLPWETVRLYQDGLPCCGSEADIVRDLAGAGSANHQLLLSLVGKGAILMGTESPELLVEEYGLMKRMLAAKDPKDIARVEAQDRTRCKALLARRDEFIAKRINETLSPGETGILFLGMLHSIGPRLARDILLNHPIAAPLRQKRQAR